MFCLELNVGRHISNVLVAELAFVGGHGVFAVFDLVFNRLEWVHAIGLQMGLKIGLPQGAGCAEDIAATHVAGRAVG